MLTNSTFLWYWMALYQHSSLTAWVQMKWILIHWCLKQDHTHQGGHSSKISQFLHKSQLVCIWSKCQPILCFCDIGWHYIGNPALLYWQKWSESWLIDAWSRILPTRVVLWARYLKIISNHSLYVCTLVYGKNVNWFSVFVRLDGIILAIQFNCMDKNEVNPDSLMPEAGSYPPGWT